MVLPTMNHMEKCYFVPMQVFEGFYAHPVPNSLVTAMVKDIAQQGRFKSTSKNKDSERMDSVVRKIYTSSSANADCEPADIVVQRRFFKLDSYV